MKSDDTAGEPERVTKKVYAFLDATSRDANDEVTGDRIGVSRSLIGQWKRAKKKGERIGPVRQGTLNAIDEFMGTDAPGADRYRAGLRAAIEEIRAKLDDLEKRAAAGEKPPQPDEGQLNTRTHSVVESAREHPERNPKKRAATGKRGRGDRNT